MKELLSGLIVPETGILNKVFRMVKMLRAWRMKSLRWASMRLRGVFLQSIVLEGIAAILAY
jgi:hypothetical protein